MAGSEWDPRSLGFTRSRKKGIFSGAKRLRLSRTDDSRVGVRKGSVVSTTCHLEDMTESATLTPLIHPNASVSGFCGGGAGSGIETEVVREEKKSRPNRNSLEFAILYISIRPVGISLTSIENTETCRCAVQMSRHVFQCRYTVVI